MLNTSEFKSVADLDKAWSEHLDSMLVGGFMVKDSPDYVSYMGAWAEAVKDLEEALAAPRFNSLS